MNISSHSHRRYASIYAYKSMQPCGLRKTREQFATFDYIKDNFTSNYAKNKENENADIINLVSNERMLKQFLFMKRRKFHASQHRVEGRTGLSITNCTSVRNCKSSNSYDGSSRPLTTKSNSTIQPMEFQEIQTKPRNRQLSFCRFSRENKQPSASHFARQNAEKQSHLLTDISNKQNSYYGKNLRSAQSAKDPNAHLITKPEKAKIKKILSK